MFLPARVRLAPTATKLPADAAGNVIVCGSHGGRYAGYLIARERVRAIVLNDAGVGLDHAGIGTLALAQGVGMAAVTVAHKSARIGDAQDMWLRGHISYVNEAARLAGCVPGLACREAAARLACAPLPGAQVLAVDEARTMMGPTGAGLRIACVDSVSLVNESDVGHIVISGSHGALVAGQHGLAIRVKAAFGVYNDAGIGCDDAGVSRLPVLDKMGVAGATVDASSARIGDARSMYASGIVSRVNALANAQGVRPGMSVQEACECIAAQC